LRVFPRQRERDEIERERERERERGISEREAAIPGRGRDKVSVV
jgi:hypothetical protein